MFCSYHSLLLEALESDRDREREYPKKIEGDDYYYVTRMNLYISHFSDGVLILRYINKMGTRGGGVVATIASHTLLARVEIPTGCKSFFSLIFVYKLTSTNSYIL